jgi:hypothetical protein
MIDVHCLIHKKSPFTPYLIKQMETEPAVTFHPIINGSNIGLGRAVGFTKGINPYVSFVDYDDMIESGIFTKINEVMEAGADWCYTDEVLIDRDGAILQPGWSSHPHLFSRSILDMVQIGLNEYANHIITLRRELLTPKILFIMKQLKELSEPYLFTELSKYERTHIKEIGYYWRQHEDNATKRLEYVQFLINQANQVEESGDGVSISN